MNKLRMKPYIIILLSVVLAFLIISILAWKYFPVHNATRFLSKNGYDKNDTEDIPIEYLCKEIKNHIHLEDNSHYPDEKEKDAVKVTSNDVFEFRSYEFETFRVEYPHDNVTFKNEEVWTGVYNRNDSISENMLLDDYNDFYMTPKLVCLINDLQIKLDSISKRLLVRVTDAYDCNMEHQMRPYKSLHYTGRAVDITIYDTFKNTTRRDLLPELYYMCIEVGFDFVLYHKLSHIHASVSPEDVHYALITLEYLGSRSRTDPSKKINSHLNDDGNGWFSINSKLEIGRYCFTFKTDKYKYGYRDEHLLSRGIKSSFVGYDKMIRPIIIRVKSKGEFNILFNPHFLKYNILSEKGKYDILDESTLFDKQHH